MKAIVLLQARTSSNRLPGKVLLPVSGIPLVILAALRASNSGHRLMVVTSKEPSDDVLCSILDNWGFEYFRGDLEDTLKRFVDALDGINDDTPVVRLTGDNVFPDGNLIDELLEKFQEHNFPYLCCGGEYSGLPYGVSAEVMFVEQLRDACKKTESNFDREHVTAWIARQYGFNYFENYRLWEMQQWRCTVDTLDDYLLIAKLFEKVDNPKNISVKTLLIKLKEISSNIVTPFPAKRMVLGTAQFGLSYGVANKTGRPEQAVVNDLIRTAISNGVQYLDTARAYDESEQAVGKAKAGGWASRVTVITKLSPLLDCPEDSDSDLVRVFTERSVYQSCHALGLEKLDILMLHRAEHLTAWHSSALDTLWKLKEKGVINRIGVSVQTPDEALTALQFSDLSFIQIPFNILDYRWGQVIEKISETRKVRPLTVHARSALLQGLLTTEKQSLWGKAHCENAAQIIDWLKEKANQNTNGDVISLCLRFVLSQEWINGLVMGVENREQLIHNLKIAGERVWDDNEHSKLINDRPLVKEKTLNPATWLKTNE